MRKLVACTLVSVPLIWLFLIGNCSAQEYRYEYSGQLSLSNGPDTLNIDGDEFLGVLTILDPQPSSTNGDRVDYNNVVGSLEVGEMAQEITDSFAIFRLETTLDVQDLGFRTPMGDFIFSLRFAQGANGLIPPPPTYDGFPVVASTLLQPQAGPNSVYQVLNPQLMVTVTPEPATASMCIAFALMALTFVRRCGPS